MVVTSEGTRMRGVAANTACAAPICQGLVARALPAAPAVMQAAPRMNARRSPSQAGRANITARKSKWITVAGPVTHW
jgi:hypothetical protein